MFDLYLSKNCFCDRIVVCGNYFDWHDREIRERFHDSPPLLCRSVEFPSWNQNKNQILLIKKPKKLNSSKKESIVRLFGNNNKFSIKISAIDPKNFQKFHKFFNSYLVSSIKIWPSAPTFSCGAGSSFSSTAAITVFNWASLFNRPFFTADWLGRFEIARSISSLSSTFFSSSDSFRTDGGCTL